MSNVLGNKNLTQAIESTGLITTPELERAGLDPRLSRPVGSVSNPLGEATANLLWGIDHKQGQRAL